MAHPQDLQLDAEESQALLAAMQPYFEEDGIALDYDAPLRWLARGEMFRGLPTASLDRVVGRVIDGWLPRGAPGAPMRRLQQEMQMLLYTQPLNDARQRGGLLPVNSVLGQRHRRAAAAERPRGRRRPVVTAYLRDARAAGDWRAWAAAWQQLDARECARCWRELDQGPKSPDAVRRPGARTWAVRWRRRLAAPASQRCEPPAAAACWRAL